MALAPGTRIGSYVIASQVGVGGMGEVYRATDTKLGRDVAIKVLPEAVAQDADRLARFDREARTLAALNHPNIAQIYGLEESPSAGAGHAAVKALVMELVEGPTLADRIAQGALSLDEALPVAKQIAEALEAAHEQGIVHRDLKPANIKVRPDGATKVLDFGLAKAMEPAGPTAPMASQAPTITTPAMTQMGLILGTAAYMAPEQASGRPVDKRADIWAFGVVLWEMLTGGRMFEGETVSHVLAAVLTKDPDLTAVPPRVRHLLARCLEKDPRKRLRDIGDAMSLVHGPETSASGAKVDAAGVLRSRHWLGAGGWAVAGVLVAALAVAAWLRPPPFVDDDPPIVRFQIERSTDIYSASTVAFAVSPDGLRLAHYGPASGGQQSLYVRTLATGEVREIPGSAAATLRVASLFWAPDGRQLVYGTATTTVVADVTTGAIRPLCDCRFVGGSWGRDGTILLGSLQGAPGGIRRVTANDSTPVVVTNADPAKREEDQWPVLLPDGRRFLFTRMVAGTAPATYVGTLDGGTPTRVTDGSRRLFVPATEVGGAYLLGMESAGFVAQPFDEKTASVTGAPVTLVAGAVAAASVSENGVLATSRPGSRPRTVPTWFDRQGRTLGTVGEAGLIQSVALTLDGRKLALDEFGSGPSGQASDVWLRDQQSGANTRMSFNPDNDSTPVWSPDGTRIAFSSFRDGMQRPHQRMADGTGDETPLFEFQRNAWVNDWSSDGRWVIYSAMRPEGAENDLWAVSIEGGVARTPVPYIEGPARQQQAQFSPDGRFVAYGSDQSGTFEIYVQPFPNASGGKWMISNGGGTEPRWSRDGRELFYFSGQTLMALPIRLQPTFSSGAPTALFDAPVLANYTNDGHRWQVAPDARRFLMLTDVGQNQAPPLDVVVNWPVLLKN